MNRCLVALALLVGCGGDATSRPTPVATVTPTPTATATATATATDAAASEPPAAPPPASPPARPRSCDDFPKVEMIRDNIVDTSITGIGEIVAASRTGIGGKTSPVPTTGYVNNVYELRVVKWLSGSGAEKLVLTQGAEADTVQLAPGAVLFFSACSSKDGTAYEPDVGYVFPIDPACRAEVEKMGETAAKRANAIGKRKRACQQPKK